MTAHCRLCLPGHPHPAPQSCFPAGQPPARAWGYPSPAPELCTPSAEFHEIPRSPILQLVQVTLDGSSPTWCFSHPSQFCTVLKLAKGALCPSIQVIQENVKQH